MHARAALPLRNRGVIQEIRQTTLLPALGLNLLSLATGFWKHT